MSSANISLEEIILRRIAFATQELRTADIEDFIDNPYSVSFDEFKATEEGLIDGYKQMLKCVNVLSEEEFLNRFINLLFKYRDKIEEKSGQNDDNIISINSGLTEKEIDIAKYEGMCSAFDDILEIIIPHDIFEEDEYV